MDPPFQDFLARLIKLEEDKSNDAVRISKLEEDKSNDAALMAKAAADIAALRADRDTLVNRVEELENDLNAGAVVYNDFEEGETMDPEADADDAVPCKVEQSEEDVTQSIEHDDEQVQQSFEIDDEPVVSISQSIKSIGVPIDNFDPNSPKFVRRRIGGKVCAGWTPTYINEEYTPEPEELAAYPDLMPRKRVGGKGPMVSDRKYAGKKVGGKPVCIKPTGDETTDGKTTDVKNTGDNTPLGYLKKRKSEDDGQDEKPAKKVKGGRNGSWTDEEYELLRDSMIERRAAEEADGNLTPFYDMKLFEVMEVTLAGQTAHPRSALACKNFWVRYGRARSGLDIDRKPTERSRSLTTSSQGPKAKQDKPVEKAKIVKGAPKAKKAKIEESESEEETMSELEQDDGVSVADDDATESSDENYSEESEDES